MQSKQICNKFFTVRNKLMAFSNRCLEKMAPKGSWWVKWFLASLGSRPTADCAILMFEVFTPFPWGVIILPSPPMSGWAMWLAPADEKGVGMTWGLMRGTVKTPLGRHQVSSLPGPLRRAVPEIRLLLQPGPCSEGVGWAGLPTGNAQRSRSEENSPTPLCCDKPLSGVHATLPSPRLRWLTGTCTGVRYVKAQTLFWEETTIQSPSVSSQLLCEVLCQLGILSLKENLQLKVRLSESTGEKSKTNFHSSQIYQTLDSFAEDGTDRL